MKAQHLSHHLVVLLFLLVTCASIPASTSTCGFDSTDTTCIRDSCICDDKCYEDTSYCASDLLSRTKIEERKSETAQVTFVLGGPGAGKGTQCRLLAKTGKFVHLSAGELLREERKRDSSVSKLIESYITEGKIVPSKVTISLLRQAMIAHGWNQFHFLIDGFPRNLENYYAWERDMRDVNVVRLLFLDCPTPLLIERILSRNETRSDDNWESLRKRLDVYREETKPVIELFQGRNMTVEIDGTPDPQVVYSQILSKLHLN